MLQGKVIDADGHILEPPGLWQLSKEMGSGMRIDFMISGIKGTFFVGLLLIRFNGVIA